MKTVDTSKAAKKQDLLGSMHVNTKATILQRLTWVSAAFLLTLTPAFAQTASYHDHNIYHGAGTAFVNTSPQAQAVGDGGVLRGQLIWNVTPGQTKGADLDLHAKLPNGVGAYTVTQFDPVGVLPGTPQKTPPFGNPNTAANGNQQVNWVNRQVVFSNGQAVASLDQDNRTGIANSPSGALVENIYIKGATAANPNNIPSGTYQFAVHNYNQTKLADPQADYAFWITTNGKVGVRSEGHYRGTGQEPGSPGLPVYTGRLTSEGESSRIYEIDIVNPGHDPHAAGVNVVDAKRRYLSAWHAEQARAQEARRQANLFHSAPDEKNLQQLANRMDWHGCPPPSVCPTTFSFAENQALAWTKPNNAISGFLGKQYTPKTIDAEAYQQKITITNYKDESNLFGTLRVIDSEYAVIATSKEHAKQLLAIETSKHQNASDINTGAVKRGDAAFQVIDLSSNIPVWGQGLALGSAVSGISTSGEEIGIGGRALALAELIPGTKQAKTAGKAINLVEDAGKVFSKEKQILVEMAKKDKKFGLTRDDMAAYQDLNQTLRDPFPFDKVRLDEGHISGGAHSRIPHGHVGPIDHILIINP